MLKYQIWRKLKMNNEGALIAFTLLIQLTAGSAMFYSLFFFINNKNMMKLNTGFTLKTPEFLLFLLTGTSVLISIFHLGNPKKAINALNNLTSSWLSLEILSLSILSFSMLLLFLVRTYFKSTKGLLSFLYLFLILSCAVLTFVMINLYKIPTVITWNTWYTPTFFILTTLILGIVGIQVIF